MPSEIRRLMFFHKELFEALNLYGSEKGYEFIGNKIINAEWTKNLEHDPHKHIEFRTEISEKYNIDEMQNSVIVTFFDDMTFEHKYYNLPAHFITEALIQYSIKNNIPLPQKSRKTLDVTEFNVCLDIIIDDKEGEELELALVDD